MSSNNLLLTTELPHETIRTTWKIKDFVALCDTLKARRTNYYHDSYNDFTDSEDESDDGEINYPYLDSPKFGVGANGPQFFLRLYTKGATEDSKDYFSLYLYLKSTGYDQCWMVVEKGLPKVRIEYDFVLLDMNGQEHFKFGL